MTVGRRLLVCLFVVMLSSCASNDDGYSWKPGDEIRTDSTGVVAPESISLPQEDIDAINKL